MKLLVFVLVLTTISSQAQHVYLRLAGESTAAGLRYGGACGYVSRGNIHAGVFFQQELPQPESLYARARTFAGLESLVPFAKTDRIYVAGHLRVGLAEKRFFVLVPGIKTGVQITQGVELGLGMHWRYHRPAHEIGIQFKI